ncbi:hypothetical protein FRC06_000801, partial [Ceratobasidium sp. 370]
MAPSAPKSPAKLAKKETKKTTKDKVFHPQSRKAGQIERAQLRKNKLADASGKRAKNLTSKADRYAFFFHALPPDVSTMTLPEIHEIIRTVWLARHDSLLEAERVQRRPGRPQSARELVLLEMKLQDEEAYRTGLKHIGAQEANAQERQKAREEKAKIDAVNRAASRQEAARAAKDVSKMDIDTE